MPQRPDDARRCGGGSLAQAEAVMGLGGGQGKHPRKAGKPGDEP